MAKKNRTGLQSEVSHIFAGVPMPKRKRPQSEQSEKKPESREPEQTAPVEKSPPEKTPVQKSPDKQPVQTDITAETTPVTVPPARESSALKVPAEQERVKETPVEKMIAPELQVEKIPVGQPSVVEPPIEQPSAPFSQATEVPGIEESVERPQNISTVEPIKSGVIEQTTKRILRKKPVISKSRRLTSKSGVSSRRQTTMVILVIALSILLFFLLVHPFDRISGNSARSGVNISTIHPLPIGANNKSAVINWSAPPVYPIQIRDPMLSISEQPGTTGTPVIAGISTSNEGEKLAIIRGTGELVKEGDEIFGWKVKKINPNSVVFEKDGEMLELEPQGKN